MGPPSLGGALPSPEERIQEIEEELRRTPHNKATEKHIATLKARLARLRRGLERRARRGRGEEGIRKTGDATVALVGFPSVGKSTLLNQITEATSKVGTYDFTTLRAVPGLVTHQGARIQLLDLPGLTEGAAQGRGGGREVLSKARIADLLLLMVDVERHDVEALVRELHAAGIRVHEEPPDVTLHPRDRGGLAVSFLAGPQEMDEATVEAMLREWGVVNAELVVRERLTPDRLVDFLAGNRVYLPAMVTLNKVDLLDEAALRRLQEALRPWEAVPISAKEGRGLDALLDGVHVRLSLIRVFLRPPGGKEGDERPLVLREGSRVEDACATIHGDLVRGFRHAKVWGPSAKFDGQRVGLDHVLEDGDTLTLVARAG